jgi:hypothetical protein
MHRGRDVASSSTNEMQYMQVRGSQTGQAPAAQGHDHHAGADWPRREPRSTLPLLARGCASLFMLVTTRFISRQHPQIIPTRAMSRCVDSSC